MSRTCRRIQGAISGDLGAAALQNDDSTREHIAECDDCFAALEAITALDDSLSDLPMVDAPDFLVAEVLSAVARERAAEGPSTRRWEISILVDPRGDLAHFAHGIWGAVRYFFAFAISHRRSVVAAATAGLALLVVRAGFDANRVTSKDSGEYEFVVEPLRFEGPGLEVGEKLRAEAPKPRAKKEISEELLVTSESPLTESKSNPAQAFEIAAAGRLLTDSSSDEDNRPMKADAEQSKSGYMGRFGASEPRDDLASAEVEAARVNEGLASRMQGLSKTSAREADAAADDGSAVWVGTRSDITFRQHASPEGVEAVRQFLEDRQRIEGLVFREPQGYWSNAYVPGDPVFRLLQARLGVESDDGGGDGHAVVAAFDLHDRVHQAHQPFDSPVNAALAVYLHSDRRSVKGENRALVQVGLQATERQGGRRPALEVALVLDLTAGVEEETGKAMRALVTALADRRDIADRFHLVVAGRPGAVMVEAAEFRHGSLVVAMEELFGVGGSTRPILDVAQAVVRASELVGRSDEASSPLGSSVVMLATGRQLGPVSTAALTTIAHHSAMAGVPLSVVGVGAKLDRRELDRLALAGQGNRRLLSSAVEAPELVDRELSAVSRVVARALRLNIRLAPGVELVDVLGSHRLDGTEAEEVREAERSIDLRLARSLAIEADRGEDEDGMQIVIPAFYAGDSHVVVLDVVVPGPGAVADVTVRYKDLVYLRNGVGRDHLSLPGGDLSAGPLEINVLKNLLALRLFEALETSGQLLMSDDLDAASSTLEECAELLEGLQAELPGLAKDRDIASDVLMLREYRELLESDTSSALASRPHLIDSMRYAARLKILPQPVASNR